MRQRPTCECEHVSEHEQANGNRRAASTQSRYRYSAIHMNRENFGGFLGIWGALVQAPGAPLIEGAESAALPHF